MEKLYSNEIVFRGHPDKVCDQISGAILDAYLKNDPNTRAGIEVAGGKGKIFVTGEITSKAKVNIPKIVRRVLADVGYDGYHYKIIVNVGIQSSDIALGVDKDGAGDQGMMFGYACSDTNKLLPKAMVILQEFAMFYDKLRQDKPYYFYPDGKAQITGIYDDDFRLVRIKTFLCSYQNCEKDRNLTDSLLKDEILKICSKYDVRVDEVIFNPTGKFEIGGFEGDAGLTGRKIVVDAYQSFANVGGGCMNGKDPTKVDFSAAHKARDIAKFYVSYYHLRWCEVQLSYAIGIDKPVAIYIDTDQGNVVPPARLYEECTPKRIIADLRLKKENYERLAMFGHFVD